jgi:hypothetical protein
MIRAHLHSNYIQDIIGSEDGSIILLRRRDSQNGDFRDGVQSALNITVPWLEQSKITSRICSRSIFRVPDSETTCQELRLAFTIFNLMESSLLNTQVIFCQSFHDIFRRSRSLIVALNLLSRWLADVKMVGLKSHAVVKLSCWKPMALCRPAITSPAKNFQSHTHNCKQISVMKQLKSACWNKDIASWTNCTNHSILLGKSWVDIY